MNTTVFELKMRPEDKKLFLEWNKEHKGPDFMLEKEPAGYFQHDEGYAEYYKKDWDEAILRTVIPVVAERALENHLFEAVNNLPIEMKYLIFHQDPGTGTATCGFCIFDLKEAKA